MRQNPVTVIYDGTCGICDALRQRAVDQDHFRRLTFIPYQTADLSRLAPGLTRDEASRSLVVILPGQVRRRGARAFFEVMRRLPGVWGVLGTIGTFPPFVWLAEPLYRVIAHHRTRISRWFGLNACELPPSSPEDSPV